MPIFEAVDLTESEEVSPYKKDCPPDRALVYCQGDTLRVLGWVGPGLDWLHGCTGDLNADMEQPPSDGLWIWEGKLTSTKDYWHDEWDTSLNGTFRPLNTQELDDLADCGLDPWDHSLWLK